MFFNYQYRYALDRDPESKVPNQLNCTLPSVAFKFEFFITMNGTFQAKLYVKFAAPFPVTVQEIKVK
jgi:hypothetical protein